MDLSPLAIHCANITPTIRCNNRRNRIVLFVRWVLQITVIAALTVTIHYW